MAGLLARPFCFAARPIEGASKDGAIVRTDLFHPSLHSSKYSVTVFDVVFLERCLYAIEASRLIVACVAIYAIPINDPIRQTFDSNVSLVRVAECFHANVYRTYVHHLTNRELAYVSSDRIVIQKTGNASARYPHGGRIREVRRTNNARVPGHLVENSAFERSLRQHDLAFCAVNFV